MPANDGSIGDDCADSGGIGPGVAPDNEEGGEGSAATSQSQTVTSSTSIPNQPQHGPESPSAPTVQGNATSEESHDADVDMHVDRTPRRARRSRRSLAAARRMQSAASIRAMVREKSRRGILVSLDARTGELELSLSHLAIDEGSGSMGGGIGAGCETNTNAASTTSSNRNHQQSRRGLHMSMASVESWMEEVRRLQEQGQVSDEMLASILAGEANASAAALALNAADACGPTPTLDGEWNDSSSSLSITDAVAGPCFLRVVDPLQGDHNCPRQIAVPRMRE